MKDRKKTERKRKEKIIKERKKNEERKQKTIPKQEKWVYQFQKITKRQTELGPTNPFF